MPVAMTADQAAIHASLSAPRMGTYLAATSGDPALALELYGWNARISAALILPTHFAEVVTLNAVSDALTRVYGARWPWNQTFETSLPAQARGYNPRRDLQAVRSAQPTTGKVIAELKFVFWQKMFTSRHDVRLWDQQILGLFPPTTAGVGATTLRQRIYDDLEVIRSVRNRMAHHEPIFTRDLARDLAMMLDLIQLRSPPTATWVRALERVSTILPLKP